MSRIEPIAPLFCYEAPGKSMRIPVGRRGCEVPRRDDSAPCGPCVDPFSAGPGSIPFADFLHAVNLQRARLDGLAIRPAPPVQAGQAYETLDAAEASDATDRGRDALLARLGDVLPPRDSGRPEPIRDHAPAIVRDIFRRHAPVGRMIDVVI